MQTLQKFRRYEFFLIFISIVIYVVRRLFQEASNFDSMVTTAELNKVPSNIIWKSLENYNHVANTNFPTIVAALLFLVAWYIFHYMTFPRIKERIFDSTTFTYCVLVVIICTASVQIYEYLKLYIRYTNDNHGAILGLKVYSQYRKSLVLTNTIAVIVILFFYETFAQFYYYIREKFEEENEKNFQYLNYFLVGTIAVFVLFVALFGNIPQKNYWEGAVRDLSLMGISMITFHFAHNYFYKNVLPHLNNIHSVEFSKKITNFLIINILGGLLMSLVEIFSWKTHSRIPPSVYIVSTIMQSVILVFISIFISFLRNKFTKEKLQLKTEVSQKSAELSNLRSQINPHFLFNALNTLYSVSLKEKADLTADGIQKLGDMMRFMLNENHQDRIPLSKEIEYLTNYIDIQRMRIDENQNIEIKVNIQNPERDIFIAPMLLNPFIENAFKHGISFRNPSWIYITLTHDAQKLYFKVHNSIHQKEESDAFSRGDEPTENTGIGLENVKKRLELIYPNRYTLDIQASDNDYFVSLILGIY